MTRKESAQRIIHALDSLRQPGDRHGGAQGSVRIVPGERRDLELIPLEFKDAGTAESFEQELELGATTTVSRLHPWNYGKNMEPLNYLETRIGLRASLTELWEECGIDPEKDPDQRATGILECTRD